MPFLGHREIVSTAQNWIAHICSEKQIRSIRTNITRIGALIDRVLFPLTTSKKRRVETLLSSSSSPYHYKRKEQNRKGKNKRKERKIKEREGKEGQGKEAPLSFLFSLLYPFLLKGEERGVSFSPFSFFFTLSSFFPLFRFLPLLSFPFKRKKIGRDKIG